jgi:hypothetical protein
VQDIGQDAAHALHVIDHQKSQIIIHCLPRCMPPALS